MKPSSYAIVSCVHGRLAITEAWAKHLAAHFHGPVVVAGDDPELHDRIRHHLGYQLSWVPYANLPLGAKWNRAAEKAIKLAPHVVILGSDDFPSPSLFEVWDHITNLGYRWACLDSIFFYSPKHKETAWLRSRYGFGTGRMFPSHTLAKLFDTKGYAWPPIAQAQLDARLFQALGAPEDDIVLSFKPDTWILAIKSDEQIHSYEKIREAHPSMLTVHQPTPEIADLITWFHSQPGVKQAKPKRRPGTGKLYWEENK